jgi:carboxymethylenebutenolidase
VAYKLEVHPGTEHGFCFRERPSYHAEAAESVWTTVFDLFSRKLLQ